MVLRAWVDGSEVDVGAPAVHLHDRGLHYGDGLFETMLLQAGRIRLWDRHLSRLQRGCDQLGIVRPSVEALATVTGALSGTTDPHILKLMVTRSGAGRGYKPDPDGGSGWIMLLYPFSPAPTQLRVAWCKTPLGRNRALAGLKHLNRLEQVLAQRELESSYDEGLMLDTMGQVVSATSGNLFVVTGGALVTADVSECGVRGVMREEIMGLAGSLNMTVRACSLSTADVRDADELFITNAVRGIRPVVQLQDRTLQVGAVTQRLTRALASV